MTDQIVTVTEATTIRPDVAHYQDSVSASGSPTKICGDDVSLLLQGATIDEVYAFVAHALDQPIDELRGRYGDKNPGQQRMFLGNLLRGALNAKDEAKSGPVFERVEGARADFRQVIDVRTKAEADEKAAAKAAKEEAKAKAEAEKAERIAKRAEKAAAKAELAPKLPTPKAAQV